MNDNNFNYCSKKKNTIKFVIDLQHKILLTYSHAKYTKTATSTKTRGDVTLNTYFKHLS